MVPLPVSTTSFTPSARASSTAGAISGGSESQAPWGDVPLLGAVAPPQDLLLLRGHDPHQRRFQLVRHADDPLERLHVARVVAVAGPGLGSQTGEDVAGTGRRPACCAAAAAP